MPGITRTEFIEICNAMIEKTRNKIAVINQLSGYVKFHKALRNEHYLEDIRDCLEQTRDEEIELKHDIIEQSGIGNCREVAEYLLVEIVRELKKYGAQATIKIIKSSEIDHVYNEVIIYDGSLVGQKYLDTATHLKQVGYKIYLIYIQIPEKIAKERALKRYQKTGRYVSGDFIGYTSQHIEQSFTKMKPLLDGYIIIDGATGAIIEKNNFIMH
ncbi:zeta toxin family protein [Legionella fallonii]|uniref:Putative Zeta toxin n=1 Tax=Legionella fallonii LLAP-10 TaxID=1212491 RepID=A0A098G434_9GAMM|nr:zeta toxin family protein [Legionella fallonii]CEG57243.1 putative Zeta toxin [Legionella fallonii LLAP-10]